MAYKLGKVYLTKEEIAAKVQKMGTEITKFYPKDESNLIAVCVLRGASLFFSDLVRAIKRNVLLEFITVSSYHNNTVTDGKVKMVQDVRISVENAHVLIVEDIIDSGYTVQFLREYFLKMGAISVKVACLLDKPSGRKVKEQADFTAHTLKDNAFVVGYGLDCAQQYRNLDAVYGMETE